MTDETQVAEELYAFAQALVERVATWRRSAVSLRAVERFCGLPPDIDDGRRT